MFQKFPGLSFFNPIQLNSTTSHQGYFIAKNVETKEEKKMVVHTHSLFCFSTSLRHSDKIHQNECRKEKCNKLFCMIFCSCPELPKEVKYNRNRWSEIIHIIFE